MNLYGFASGDPVNFSDPMGLCPVGGWSGFICNGIEAATTALGTLAGIVGGGGGGALVAAASGGAGVAAVSMGAYAGAAAGAGLGLVGGKALTGVLFNESGAGGGAGSGQAAREWLGQTNRDNPGLNRTLSKWFKEGGELPKSITREYLDNYLTAARDAIARNVERLGEQAKRVKQITDALKNTP